MLCIVDYVWFLYCGGFLFFGDGVNWLGWLWVCLLVYIYGSIVF